MRSATGVRQSGPASMPANPFLIPNRQPTLPALQSVSQPAVFTMCIVSWKLFRP
jgi:hypothetical protein